jgi:hypothetical protein
MLEVQSRTFCAGCGPNSAPALRESIYAARNYFAQREKRAMFSPQ